MTSKLYNILSIAAVCIAVVGLTVAFAALNTTLTVSGTSMLKQASWEIRFQTPTNIQNSAGARFTTAPNVVGTATSFVGELDEPGDYLEFTLPIKNNGTIDAILSTVITSVTGIDNDLLNFTVVDATATPLANGSMTLDGGETKNITLRLTYMTDINPVDLPVANRSLAISVTLLWEQN